MVRNFALTADADYTDKEAERLFAGIGRYVIFFQLLEGKVDECLLLLWGHENWNESQARLSKMTNFVRVNELLRAFQECPQNARGRTRPDWVNSFEELTELLHAERDYRNTLLHSGFLFDFPKIGHPVLMIDRKAGNTEKGATLLTDALQKKMIDRIVDLYLRVSHAHLQLVHDYDA